MKYYHVSFNELSKVLGPLYTGSRQNYLFNSRAERLQSEAHVDSDDVDKNLDTISIDTATSLDIKANVTTTSYEPSQKEQESENNQEVSKSSENKDVEKIEHRKSRTNTFRHIKKFFHIGKKNKNKKKGIEKSEKSGKGENIEDKESEVKNEEKEI